MQPNVAHHSSTLNTLVIKNNLWWILSRHESAMLIIYNKVKSQVKELLSRAKRVVLTWDSWPSQATECYITIEAHYTAESSSLSSHVLQTWCMCYHTASCNISSWRWAETDWSDVAICIEVTPQVLWQYGIVPAVLITLLPTDLWALWAKYPAHTFLDKFTVPQYSSIFNEILY